MKQYLMMDFALVKTKVNLNIVLQFMIAIIVLLKLIVSEVINNALNLICFAKPQIINKCVIILKSIKIYY